MSSAQCSSSTYNIPSQRRVSRVYQAFLTKHREHTSRITLNQYRFTMTIMGGLCQMLTIALFATLTQAIPFSLQDKHIASTYSNVSSAYQQQPPQLYARHSNIANTTFTYPYSHLPPNRSTAARKSYQGFLVLGTIIACLPFIGALAWLIQFYRSDWKKSETEGGALHLAT